jgi:hypothetical protein
MQNPETTVLSFSNDPNHLREREAASAVPQPTDNTHSGSHHLVEVRKKKLGSSDTRSQKDIPITEFFNTHAC